MFKFLIKIKEIFSSFWKEARIGPTVKFENAENGVSLVFLIIDC